MKNIKIIIIICLFFTSLFHVNAYSSGIFGYERLGNNVNQLMSIDPTTGTEVPIGNIMTFTGYKQSALNSDTDILYFDTFDSGTAYLNSVDINTGNLLSSVALSNTLYNLNVDTSPAPVVPEPISSLLFVAGGTLLAGRRYFKRKNRA